MRRVAGQVLGLAGIEDEVVELLLRIELLGPALGEGWSFESKMRRQSDEINDDWVLRFGELKVGQQPWAAPAVEAPG